VTLTYTVTGEDGNGCTSTAIVQQSVSPCTDIQSQNANASIKVYPNPNTGLATIELNQNAQVIVMSVIGSIISNENLSAGTHQLDLTQFANGIYFVKLIHGGQQQTLKLIKE
jgi:hypothetical protein